MHTSVHSNPLPRNTASIPLQESALVHLIFKTPIAQLIPVAPAALTYVTCAHDSGCFATVQGEHWAQGSPSKY